MTEEEKQEQEPVQEQPVQEEVKEEVQQPQPTEDPNWKFAREVMSSQKNEIEVLKRQIQELATPKPPQEVDEFADLDENDTITIAQAKKLSEKQAKKAAEGLVKEYLQKHSTEIRVQSAEVEARQKYSDYDYVINTFTIPQVQRDPALAHKIANSPNPAITAYKLGKLSDEYEAQVTKQNVNPKAEKIVRNSQRPSSAHSATAPLKSQVDDVTKMSSADVWNLSQKYARGG